MTSLPLLSLELSADDINAYGIVIGGSAVIILSYFANLLARRTNIPSVLVLIAMGIGLRQGLRAVGLHDIPFEGLILELLGTVGLIFIVLEAALDLELTRDKPPRPSDSPKYRETFAISSAMENWRDKR